VKSNKSIFLVTAASIILPISFIVPVNAGSGFVVCDYKHQEATVIDGEIIYPTNFSPMVDYTIGINETCPLPLTDNNNRVHNFTSVGVNSGSVRYFEAVTENEINCKIRLSITTYEDMFIF